jgi:hypothetical protein
MKKSFSSSKFSLVKPPNRVEIWVLQIGKCKFHPIWFLFRNKMIIWVIVQNRNSSSMKNVNKKICWIFSSICLFRRQKRRRVFNLHIQKSFFLQDKRCSFSFLFHFQKLIAFEFLCPWILKNKKPFFVFFNFVFVFCHFLSLLSVKYSHFAN